MVMVILNTFDFLVVTFFVGDVDGRSISIKRVRSIGIQ